MPKLTGPLFSVEAHKQLAKGLTFQRRPSGASVYGYKKPKVPLTDKQIWHRRKIAWAVLAWQGLSDKEKAEWEKKAKGQGQSGYSYFIKQRYNEFNLIENGDFEIGDPPSKWTIGLGSFFRSSEQVKIGSYSGKVISAAGYIGWVYQNTGPVPSGKKYIMGAWIWCDTPGKAFIRIDDLGGGDESGYHPGDSQMHWITVTRTKVSGTVLQVSLRVEKGTITAYYDCALVRYDVR